MRGETRHAGWGQPLPAENRPEKIERGHMLVAAVRGRGTKGAVPIPPRQAYEAIVADLASAALVPEWKIDRLVEAGNWVDGRPTPPTPRMVEYAQGYANGESATELANRLGVRMESVSRGFERLRACLDARSRYQAIAMLVYAGYISAPPMPDYAKSGRGERAVKLHHQKQAIRSATKITKREVETLALMAEGLSNDEIAERMGLSVETVKSRARTIARKLDARTRAHAVAVAFRAGLIE